ncbi:stealth family protein [Actinoplanes sp. NPDC049668]|uniref:stealth family protein n=1 Tax=unclassified Actinoplanes TaxID=2626549 RepID=UPI0033A931AE
MAERRVELTIDLLPRTVHVHEGLTPLRARSLNLTAVTGALEAAGLEHFVVRGTQDCASVVAVREDRRAEVLACLRALGRDSAAYVAAVLPRPPARDLFGAAGEPGAWRRPGQAKVLRLFWFRTDPARTLVHDREYGCDVEFWEADGAGVLTAPRTNRATAQVPAGAATVPAPAERFTRLGGDGPAPVRTRPEMTVTLPDDIGFPIDVVYTWVDGTDPAWQRRRAQVTGDTYHEESASAARFLSRDELRFSLRSVHANAPWVRNIFIVTDDQVPDWLDTGRPNLRVVSHKEIFSDPSVLPVFNSHAIESQLHHIDGLAEHFVYFNDDMFIGRPLAPQSFFLSNGLSRFFLSQGHVPLGPVSADDTPVDAACKNNRRLLEERFGVTITQVFQHVPYALRRSVMSELEADFPDEYARTMASRFRSTQDLSTVSNLYHYYAYHTGRALPGTVRYGYVQLAVPDLAARLSRILARRDWDAFCLNDAYSQPEELAYQHAVLLPFLESYFPVASPYELS